MKSRRGEVMNGEREGGSSRKNGESDRKKKNI